MSSTGSTIISRPARRTATLALGGVALAYPLLVYAGLGTLPAAAIGAALLAALAVRFALAPAGPFAAALAIGAGAFGLLLVAAPAIAVRAWPVLISAALAAVFAWTLRCPPSAIERVARLAEPNLPQAGVAYTRKATAVWLGFFVANALVAAWTPLFASLDAWTLYNGLISYLIIGLIFAVEWIVRRRARGPAA